MSVHNWVIAKPNSSASSSVGRPRSCDREDYRPCLHRTRSSWLELLYVEVLPDDRECQWVSHCYPTWMTDRSVDPGGWLPGTHSCSLSPLGPTRGRKDYSWLGKLVCRVNVLLKLSEAHAEPQLSVHYSATWRQLIQYSFILAPCRPIVST